MLDAVQPDLHQLAAQACAGADVVGDHNPIQINRRADHRAIDIQTMLAINDGYFRFDGPVYFEITCLKYGWRRSLSVGSGIQPH